MPAPMMTDLNWNILDARTRAIAAALEERLDRVGQQRLIDRLDLLEALIGEVRELRHEVATFRKEMEKTMSKQTEAIADLQTKVANDTTVQQSAITLLQGLKAQLDAAIAAAGNIDDSSQLAELSATIGANASALAAAVTANTSTPPAAPAPSGG